MGGEYYIQHPTRPYVKDSRMNKKHFDVKVGGHVQGVFYRASAIEKARELGLSGFIRNENDGSVYIEAEGSAEDLLRFVEWTKIGPPRAKVQSCEVKEGPLKNFSGFEIQR
jgi:acylphosphatase